MARSSLLHYQHSFADPNFYDQSSQLLHSTAGAHQNTSTRSQLIGNYHQAQEMAQPYNQHYTSDRRLESQQWSQSTAYMRTGGAQAGRMLTATSYPRDPVWNEAAPYEHGLAFESKPQLAPNIPQVDGSSYGNAALTYPELASSAFGSNGGGGCAVSWPTPKSFGFSGSMRSDTFDRGGSHSLSPKSYNSETQPSEVHPFTPKSIPSAASAIGDWSCESAQPYVPIKTSSPDARTWDTGQGGGGHLLVAQHGLHMSAPIAASIESSQDFNGLPASYPDSSQYSSDYSYSQQSSPDISSGFHGGTSLNSGLLPYQASNFLAHSAPIYDLPTREQARTSNAMSTSLTGRGGPFRGVPQREDDQGSSTSRSAPDANALRRADDAILLEGKRNGLTYKDIRNKMHKKCAESTLRGRYRSLTKARQDRVRKPVWREKDIELLTEFVTRDLDRIDASHQHSLNHDQRLAKVQWKKIADAIHRNGGSYHFGNSTCKRKWVELNSDL